MTAHPFLVAAMGENQTDNVLFVYFFYPNT